MFLRGNFNSSGLVRLLGEWSGGDAEAPRQDLAERLAHWLGVADAITLHAAQQTVRAARPLPAARGTPRAGAPLAAQLQQVRATLERAIRADDLAGLVGQPSVLRAGHGADQPASAQANRDEAAADYALYHQRYLDLQRRMEMAIDALRGHVRQTLARQSPRLARLAALDAVLDPMLGGREQQLLGTVPGHLKHRFEQLRRAADADWRPRFAADVQQALLAELDLRLQPVLGLVEAQAHETPTPQESRDVQEVKPHP